MELEKNLLDEEQAAATEVTEPTAQDVPAQDAPEEAAEDSATTAEVAAPEADENAAEAEAEAAPEAEAATEAAPVAEAAAEAEAAPEATSEAAPARRKSDAAREAKEALIERAKELADSTDWRRASEAQRTLMEQWRAAGYAGRDLNDKLWEDFRAARDVFYTRRDAHYAELREQQGKVVETKRAIIEEAREATANIQNWVKTSGVLNDLMERWKAAGNAGREMEQQLWEEFNGIRRDFRARRKADLAERRARERAAADAKRAIVEEAQAIAAGEAYSRETSDRMRQLSDEYKAAGYAGKPANDELWEQFRAAQNAYWAANNAARDQQRRERSERLQEAVERKSGQIEHLKDQNETLTTRLEQTLNPEKVAQIKRWIAENEERAHGLADDISEIQKKI